MSILEFEFPKKIEFPHYDKYNGNGDPSNVLSLEFSHKDDYLMRLFPRSLKGQAMEWFTKITPHLKILRTLFKNLFNTSLTMFKNKLMCWIYATSNKIEENLLLPFYKDGESYVLFILEKF